MNWTGIELSLPIGDYQLDIHNSKRCFPIDIFKKEYLVHLYDQISPLFESEYTDFFSYYPNCLLLKNNITTSNLKPRIPSISFSDDDISYIKKTKYGWKIYLPYELLDIDIGTLKGLEDVIEWLTKNHGNEIMHIVVDENIFYRMLRVSHFFFPFILIRMHFNLFLKMRMYSDFLFFFRMHSDFLFFFRIHFHFFFKMRMHSHFFFFFRMHSVFLFLVYILFVYF